MRTLAVIISVYKNDQFDDFIECIQSILHQTFNDYDVWIQLDGKVAFLIEEYLDFIQDVRFHVRKRAYNKGLANSLNDLLEEVLEKEYEYVARMDADDICLHDRFKQQISYMEQHSEVDIVGGYIEEMTEKGKKVGIVKYPLQHNEMKIFFGKRNPLAHMTVLFRKSYFDKAGLYPTNTDKDEDTMFWLNGFLHGCVFANIDKVVVKVRVSDNFYQRRSGRVKSWNDFKNRCRIISLLNLPGKNYLYAFGRFLLFLLPFPALMRLAYRYLR